MVPELRDAEFGPPELPSCAPATHALARLASDTIEIASAPAAVSFTHFVRIAQGPLAFLLSLPVRSHEGSQVEGDAKILPAARIFE